MGRPSNRGERRDAIARAMIRVLAREGYVGASMRAVAVESGLAQGLLHYHFTSKSEIAVAALAAVEAHLRDRVAERERTGAAPLDALIDGLLAPGGSATDAEMLAAWVALGDAAGADRTLQLVWGDALTRLRAALLDRFGPAPGAEVFAAAALCQVEGAWRIGRLAPSALSAGTAATALRAMLAASRGLPPPPSSPVAAVTALTSPRSSLRLPARQARWLRELRQASPMALPESAWGVLAAGYCAPERHYHTLEHLVEMARTWREVAAGPGWRDPAASWLALLFHDAVYDVRRPPGASEAASAELLEALLPGNTAAARLVRLTASHGRDADLDPDSALFLDCDLAILGASPRRFARYELEVAAEYVPVVGREGWTAGRKAFLERMLARTPIFHSTWFRERLEARARANLALRVGVGPT